MAYDADLYNRATPSDNLGADVLIPKTDNSGMVDVYRDYTWTLSEQSVRDYVPYVELTEYKQVLSSEISGFFYNLAGIADNARVGQATAANTLNQTAGAANQTIKRGSNSLSSLANNLFGNGFANGINNIANSITDAVQKQISNIDTKYIDGARKDDLTAADPYDRSLQPYLGLYSIKPTGWSYTLPFLTSSNMLTPGNQWGDTSTQIRDTLAEIGSNLGAGQQVQQGQGQAQGQDVSGPGVFGVMKAAAAASRLPLAATAGRVVAETPKSFSSTGSDSVTVVFYLYNTKSFDDIKANWEFCFLFTYQNLPNRKGVNLLDPPCLYKVLIPGYKQLPLCWVSDLKVENVGAVKLINMQTGSMGVDVADNPLIKMIPEAYKVTVTFQSVLMNARNIFSYAEDPSKKVTVSMTGQP